MKYAFIALIAIYLVIYGCSPDAPEKATDSHQQTASVTAENTTQSETVAVPAEHQDATETIEKVVVEEPTPTDEVVQQADPILDFKVVEQAPGDQAGETQMVVMPCGRKMALADIPPDAPCFNMQPQGIEEDTDASADNQQELAAAIHRMVETTNDMVQATRQLVNATQEMLKASQGVTKKVVPTEETPPAQ